MSNALKARRNGQPQWAIDIADQTGQRLAEWERLKDDLDSLEEFTVPAAGQHFVIHSETRGDAGNQDDTDAFVFWRITGSAEGDGWEYVPVLCGVQRRRRS